MAKLQPLKLRQKKMAQRLKIKSRNPIQVNRMTRTMTTNPKGKCEGAVISFAFFLIFSNFIYVIALKGQSLRAFFTKNFKSWKRLGIIKTKLTNRKFNLDKNVFMTNEVQLTWYLYSCISFDIHRSILPQLSLCFQLSYKEVHLKLMTGLSSINPE